MHTWYCGLTTITSISVFVPWSGTGPGRGRGLGMGGGYRIGGRGLGTVRGAAAGVLRRGRGET